MAWIFKITVFILLSTVESESILKCYGDYFDDRICTYPSYIDVQSARHGESEVSAGEICDPNKKICSEDIESIDEDYYEEIKLKCNGRQTCDNLRADWYPMPNCVVLSNYVEILYVCLRDGSTITPPPLTTTTESTTSTSVVTTTIPTTTITTNTSTEDGDDPGGGGLSGGAIAGIVIGVLVGVALTAGAVVLFIMCRRDPEFASQAKTTAMKPFSMMKRDKKTTRTDSSSSSGTTDTAPDILRHPHINGYSKPKIKHQNEKMNRDTTCRSGIGPEIVLTPQEAGAKPPNATTIHSLHAPKPSIEIVSTPQEAIRRTKNNLPYSPETTAPDEENPYEAYEDLYDEFNDHYEDEYAEISDFERTDDTNETKRKKPSIKPKPNLKQNQLKSTPKAKEATLSDEIMNHIQKRKDLLNNSGNNTARSSLEMTENDDLYYNSTEVDPPYEVAEKVDSRYMEAGAEGGRYYDLQPQRNQKSTKYEQLRYNDNSGSSTEIPAIRGPQGNQEAPRHRRSRDMYDDDAEYYDDDDEWSSDGSTEDYMGDEGIRTSVLAAQDGYGKDYNRKKSSTEC